MLALASKFSAVLQKMVPIATAVGGLLLFLFSILLMIGTSPDVEVSTGPGIGTPVLYLIFGILVAVVGALGLIPATASYIGLGGSGQRGPSGGFGGPPPGGASVRRRSSSRVGSSRRVAAWRNRASRVRRRSSLASRRAGST